MYKIYFALVQFIQQALWFADQTWLKRKLPTLLSVSAFIIFWCAPYLYTVGLIEARPGDTDYFFQSYEAIRKTIIDYNQFPWWNSWVGGGVPLFANPQVGVFSLQTPLVLIFGTVFGLKLSVVIYTLIAYWGSFFLFYKKLKSRVGVAFVLSFCWIANGFFVAHLFQHYSFVYYMLAPLAVYLQLSIRQGFYWAWHGILMALIALAALHYAFLQILLILALVATLQIFLLCINHRWAELKITLKKMLGSVAIFLFIAGTRVFYAAQYALQFPKSYEESLNSPGILLKGLLTPGASSNFLDGRLIGINNQYGAHEYSTYMGLGVFIASTIILFSLALKITKLRKKFFTRESLSAKSTQIALCFVAASIFFLVAIGNWGALSPLDIIMNLPGYASMRVSSRWLIWVVFFILCAIALFLGRSKIVKIRLLVFLLVIIGTVELFIFGFWSARHTFNRDAVQFRDNKTEFIQYENYIPQISNETELYKLRKNDRGNYHYSFEATLNNIGELNGYEPLFMTLKDTAGRCGTNSGCGVVVSENAKIVTWTPNKITLKRYAGGVIYLNIAPSSYWTVNGKRLLSEKNVVGPGRLAIEEPGPDIVISISPP